MNATTLLDSLDRLLRPFLGRSASLRLRSHRGPVTWYRVGSAPQRPTFADAIEIALQRARLNAPTIESPESQEDCELARRLINYLWDHPGATGPGDGLTLYRGPEGYRVRCLSGTRATLRDALEEALR